MNLMPIIGELKKHLMDPKFLHVLLCWGQLWGFFFGSVLLVLAKWALKDERVVKLSLILLGCMGLLTYGIAHNAKRANVGTFTAESAEQRKTHEAEKSKTAVFFYVFAALCALNALGRVEGGMGKWIFIAVVAGGFLLTGLSLLHQVKESKLVYREF
jgi:hypothetical protein